MLNDTFNNMSVITYNMVTSFICVYRDFQQCVRYSVEYCGQFYWCLTVITDSNNYLNGLPRCCVYFTLCLCFFILLHIYRLTVPLPVILIIYLLLLPISFVRGILIGYRASHGVFYPTLFSLITRNTSANTNRR